MIDNAEKYLSETYHCIATIHMDPIVTDDPDTASIKSKVTDALTEIDARLTLHDFRMSTTPTGKTLLFDVVLPYDSSLKEDAIKVRIDAAIQAIDPHAVAVVEFDRGESMQNK